jgi:copper transport protein
VSAVRRVIGWAVVALAVVAATAGPAEAHAVLVASSPPANGRVKVGPASVVLRFSEPVQLFNRTDVTVVDGDGVRIDKGTARTAARDSREVIVAVRGPLVADSYTVRFRVVSADSHSALEAYAFAVGDVPLRPPILAGAGGLSDGSAAAVAIRVVEFAALIFLVGLVAFRALVWGPAVATAPGLSRAARDSALRNGTRAFWRAFWAAVVLAGVAETAVLAAKSAVAFHTNLITAALHPADAYRMVAASRFGDLFGWRCGALSLVAVVGFLAWNHESEAPPDNPRRKPMAVLAVLALAALTLLAAQGHASQAQLAPLAVALDAAHLTAVSVWIGGLVCLAVVLQRAPRALPEAGRALAGATLSRFSHVALWSVAIIAMTGIARAIGELSAPGQLVSTGYGHSLMLKSSLLAAVLVIARHNRRIADALARGARPSVATMRATGRAVQAEFVIGMGIVAVAAILVAQLPGRA